MQRLDRAGRIEFLDAQAATDCPLRPEDLLARLQARDPQRQFGFRSRRVCHHVASDSAAVASGSVGPHQARRVVTRASLPEISEGQAETAAAAPTPRLTTKLTPLQLRSSLDSLASVAEIPRSQPFDELPLRDEVAVF